MLEAKFLNEAVVGAPWHPTPGAQREGDEVPAARYPIAEGGGEQPLPVQPAVRSGQGGGLGPCKVYIRAHPCRCGNMEGRRFDQEHSEDSKHIVQRKNHVRNAP